MIDIDQSPQEMKKHRKMLKPFHPALKSGGRLVLVEPFDPEKTHDHPNQSTVETAGPPRRPDQRVRF